MSVELGEPLDVLVGLGGVHGLGNVDIAPDGRTAETHAFQKQDAPFGVVFQLVVVHAEVCLGKVERLVLVADGQEEHLVVVVDKFIHSYVGPRQAVDEPVVVDGVLLVEVVADGPDDVYLLQGAVVGTCQVSRGEHLVLGGDGLGDEVDRCLHLRVGNALEFLHDLLGRLVAEHEAVVGLCQEHRQLVVVLGVEA